MLIQGPRLPCPQLLAPRRRLALVVEAAPADRAALCTLAQQMDLNVVQATSADVALAALAAPGPDVIFLDLALGGADGMALLVRIREERPFIPVVVVSETDDPETIDEALNLGAVNFLRKPVGEEEFRFVLDRITRSLEEEQGIQEALANVIERNTSLTIPGDPALVGRVVAFFGQEVRSHYPGRDVPLPDIKLALFEALANAVEHGNLEIGYEGKAEALQRAEGLRDLVAERMHRAPYASRKVHVKARYGPEHIEYVITDEGRGFDPMAYDPERALSDVNRLHGRGLALIRHYMDEVSWNDRGNEIRMVVHLDGRGR